MMDEAYRVTIAAFCDSVFPPQTPSSGKAWTDATTSFHNQTLQIANRHIGEISQYIPESTIPARIVRLVYQSLVASVFNQMRNKAPTIKTSRIIRRIKLNEFLPLPIIIKTHFKEMEEMVTLFLPFFMFFTYLCS